MRPLLLAIDTAGTRALVALGEPDGALVAQRRWAAGYRHGEELLAQVDRLMSEAGAARPDVSGIVVGTGPGAFTGLRVGLATAKALAHGLGVPIAGVATSTALLDAAGRDSGGRLALLLPAGPSDRVLVQRGEALLIRGGEEPDLEEGTTLVAVDLPERAPADALARGEGAEAGLAEALLRLGAARLAGGGDDLARLEPEYVTLPRGLTSTTGDVRWSREPATVTIDRMKAEDLDAVHGIERDSFSTPWPPQAYRQELETNRLAHYLVARADGEIVGFAGLWMLVDEAHITTFATGPAWRRRGIGERMLLALLDLAGSRGAHEATLEVRPTNAPARRLYEKYGFKVMGVRPRYYTDNNEDALIMTTEPLDGRAMIERLARLRAELERRPGIEVGANRRPITTGDEPRKGSSEQREPGQPEPGRRGQP